MCAHIPWTLWVSTSYLVFMATNALQFMTPLPPICEMLVSTWDKNNYMHFLQPHCWWVDIVFTKDGIHTLTNIIIVNPTRPDLLPWSCAIQRFVTSNATQVLKSSYHNQHPIDQFLPLTIELFGYLDKMSMCFYTTVPMPFGAWRGQKALIFLPWSFFFFKKFRSHYKGCKCLPF